MNQKSLTDRQLAIVQFIRQSIEANHRPPTFREIMLHFGMRSTSGVTCHLIALAKKGIIDWDRTSTRGIKLRGVKIIIVDLQQQSA